MSIIPVGLKEQLHTAQRIQKTCRERGITLPLLRLNVPRPPSTVIWKVSSRQIIECLLERVTEKEVVVTPVWVDHYYGTPSHLMPECTHNLSDVSIEGWYTEKGDQAFGDLLDGG
jgi:hypothetical protein